MHVTAALAELCFIPEKKKNCTAGTMYWYYQISSTTRTSVIVYQPVQFTSLILEFRNISIHLYQIITFSVTNSLIHYINIPSYSLYQYTYHFFNS